MVWPMTLAGLWQICDSYGTDTCHSGNDPTCLEAIWDGNVV